MPVGKTLGAVEDTLFVPMAGRIYASEHHSGILYDEMALSLKGKLPASSLEKGRHSEYTLLASASRSADMDFFIKDFLTRNPDGVVVQLGAGLETTFWRCKTRNVRWYAVDLPEVIAFRKSVLPGEKNEICLPGDAFSEEWIREVRDDVGDAPLLVTAAGLFHYFPKEKVTGLVRMLSRFGGAELVFDAVSGKGLEMMNRKYMKQMGHADAGMRFSVDSGEELAKEIGPFCSCPVDEAYYKRIPRKGLKLITRISMDVSDRGKMVKMLRLKVDAADPS